MKEAIKSFLRKKNAYTFLKYSRIFLLYEHLFKSEVVKQHQREVNLYKKILGSSCSLIFDIGAYDGHKTAAFLSISNKVVSCEPDPFNFKLLQMRFRRKKDKVVLCNKALSNNVGRENFLIHHEGSAFNTLNNEWKNILEKDNKERWSEKIDFIPDKSIQVETTTLDTLIKKHGTPDFIKVDVEGYEKEVFQGLSQKIPCVSFECLLPEFTNQLEYIMNKLISFDDKTVFNVVVDEELIFFEFLTYQEIKEWLKKTDIHCFDMIMKSK